MGLLVFIVVVLAVVGTPLVLFLARSRLRPGAAKVILIGVTSGEAEKNLWVGALRSSGISPHVRVARDIPAVGVPAAAIGYEVWVPTRDEARARNILGKG